MIQTRRYFDLITGMPLGTLPCFSFQRIANFPAFEPVVREPTKSITLVYGSSSWKLKYRLPMSGWLSTIGPLPRSR